MGLLKKTLLINASLGLCLLGSSAFAHTSTSTSVLSETEIVDLAEKILADADTKAVLTGTATLSDDQIKSFAKTISSQVNDYHQFSGEDFLALSKQISNSESNPYYGTMDDKQIKLLNDTIQSLLANKMLENTPNMSVSLSEQQLQTLADTISQQVLAGLQSPPASSTPSEPTNGEPQEASDVETIKDWSIGCDPVGDNAQRCYIYQTIADQNGVPVLQAAVGELPGADGKLLPTAIFTVPLGINLRAGFKFAVDGGKDGLHFGYDQCGAVGCNAVLPLDKKWLSKFKAGNKVSILINDGQQNLELTLSLQGFTKGLARAKELSN